MKAFCKDLPKIELHAHLNGSLSSDTLKYLGCVSQSVAEYQKLNTLLEKAPRKLSDCFPLFKVAHDVTKTKERVYLATQSVIQDFEEENVIYLELRTTPRCGNNFDKEGYIETVVQAIKDFKTDKIIVRLILCIDRRHDLQTSLEAMVLIIKMKLKYPDVIKGVDLCGDPHEGEFNKRVFARVRQYDLKVSLHCGEIANIIDMEEMLNFGPDRIGHGTCIHEDHGGSDYLWQKFKDLKIPVECCLTSNIICGTKQSYTEHHVRELLRNKIPFCICTDDKGVFCTDLSNEFYLMNQHYGLSKLDLWQISFDTADMIFEDNDMKTHLKNMLIEWRSKHFIN